MDPVHKQMLKVGYDYFRASRHDPKATAYLEGRGFSRQILDEFECGYATAGFKRLYGRLKKRFTPEQLRESGLLSFKKQIYDLFNNRVMFPIRDSAGTLVGFGGRTIETTESDKGPPKYINSADTPFFHKKEHVYGLHLVLKKNANLGRILVQEGYLDVIRCHEYGISDAVAPLGTALTTEQIDKIFQHTDQITLCFDGDKAGYKAARRASELILPFLSPGRYAEVVFMPPGHDPDSFIKNEGAEAYRNWLNIATPVTTFLSNTLYQEICPNNDIGSVAAFLNAVEPLIQQMPKGDARDQWIGGICNKACVSEGSTTTLFHQYLSSEPNDVNPQLIREMVSDFVSNSGGVSMWDQVAETQRLEVLIHAAIVATNNPESPVAREFNRRIQEKQSQGTELSPGQQSPLKNRAMMLIGKHPDKTTFYSFLSESQATDLCNRFDVELHWESPVRLDLEQCVLMMRPTHGNAEELEELHVVLASREGFIAAEILDNQLEFASHGITATAVNG